VLDGISLPGNPFDPDEVAVDAEVRCPSGRTYSLPGFWYGGFERSLRDGKETLEKAGEPAWRLRVLPTEAGTHAVRVSAKSRGKEVGSGAVEFNVRAAKRRGLARLDSASKRYFVFDDGTPLFLCGLNVCWHGERGTFDYDDWFAAQEKAGINFVRFWMWPEAFGIEWDREDRLHYKLDRAWTLDRALAEAEKRGILVMLCLDYHGMFEVKKDYWGGNDYWTRNPYNAANGGPSAQQNDFFTSAEAAKIYAKRLRYIVARWSAFPSIFAWEFYNEIDNEFAYLKEADVVAWHGKMARELRALDPYRHLISSSLTGSSERPAFWEVPEMEFAQYHSYNEKYPADMMAKRTRGFLERYKKPFFVGEYGTDWRGWKPETDPYLRALHQAVWSGAFTGAAGTGMSWWWESIHAAGRYGSWSSLSSFLKGTAVARSDMAPAEVALDPGDKARGLAVLGKGEALLWILDRAYSWPDGAMDKEPKPCEGLKVTLRGLTSGTYAIEWWDPAAASVIKEELREVTADGRLECSVPPFKMDMAVRMKAR
jgi:hypothetical protein